MCKSPSFRPKFHFLNYIFHISRELHKGRYTLRPYTLQYVYSCPLVLSQIYNIEKLYGNKWIITSFRTKFHFLNYIFHISREPHKGRYTLRPYTLQYVYSCPLVMSQIYNIEKLYGNKWVNYEFLPKISLFTLYFSHLTGNHIKADIRWDPKHCNMCIAVHW